MCINETGLGVKDADQISETHNPINTRLMNIQSHISVLRVLSDVFNMQIIHLYIAHMWSKRPNRYQVIIIIKGYEIYFQVLKTEISFSLLSLSHRINFHPAL
jgi:hypothetical protein